jgi:hypothetical protein
MAISSQSEQECSAGSTTSAYSPERTMGHHERAATRVCSKCRIRPVVWKTNPWCKECSSATARAKYAASAEYRAADNAKTRKFYRENRAAILAQKSEYGKRVNERDKARRRERYANDPKFRAATNARTSRYYADKPEVFRARDARRRAEALKATPAWADHKAIRAVYAKARRLTAESGIQHEVDHVVPLKGRKVCGLHVHQNLQVITRLANRRKFIKLVDEIV